jgi:hypothetical protein
MGRNKLTARILLEIAGFKRLLIMSALVIALRTRL